VLHYDTCAVNYKRENEALATGNAHIKKVLHVRMGRAVVITHWT